MSPGVLAALLLGLLGPEASDTPAIERQCGTRSLYLLLRLMGHEDEFTNLVARAPTPPPGGYSMLELKNLAGRAGSRLEGIRLPAEGPAIDRPMLVHLDQGEHGHYVVVRPVGHTGKLVQVLDPSGSVEVVDADRLASSPSWTGRALAERRPFPTPVLLLVPAFLAGLFLVLRPGRRRSLPAPAAAP